jgi:L-serine dehydratase
MYLGFDMLKIGIGPSVRILLGLGVPANDSCWIAHKKPAFDYWQHQTFTAPFTNRNRATDLAVMLGLSGPMNTYLLTTLTVSSKQSKNTRKNWETNSFRLIPLPQLFLIKNSSRFTQTEWLLQLTPTLLSNTATYYSIGGGFVVKEAYQCKEKNSYKMCFSFLNRKTSDTWWLCHSENKKISDIVYENEKSMFRGGYS